MAMVAASSASLNIARRQLVAPLPKKAIVKPPGEPWRELKPGEENDARYYVDLSTFATMCPMAKGASAAKHLEHAIVFQMPMLELAVSDALKQQCFPDPNEPIALALVRCRRDEDQWLVLLADLWQHTNEISLGQNAMREVKTALKLMHGEDLRCSNKVLRLGQFLQSLDPAEIKYAPSVNLSIEMFGEEAPWLTMKAVTKFFTQHFAAAMSKAVDHHLKAHGLEGHEGQAAAIGEILDASDASKNAALEMAGAQGSLALQGPDMQALIGAMCTQSATVTELTEFAKTTHSSLVTLATETNTQLQQTNTQLVTLANNTTGQINNVFAQVKRKFEEMEEDMQKDHAELRNDVGELEQKFNARLNDLQAKMNDTTGMQEITADRKRKVIVEAVLAKYAPDVPQDYESIAREVNVRLQHIGGPNVKLRPYTVKLMCSRTVFKQLLADEAFKKGMNVTFDVNKDIVGYEIDQ